MNDKVDEKSKEVTKKKKKKINFDLQSILDGMRKPYLLFDEDGIVQSPFSSRVQEFLEVDNPDGMYLLDVLRVKPRDRASYGNWIELLFSDALSFEEAALLGPDTFDHNDPDKKIRVEYRPIRSKRNKMQAVLLFMRDAGVEILQREEYEEREMRSKFLLKAFTFRSQFVDFIAELKNVIIHLRDYANKPSAEYLLEAKRSLHTLTGATSYFHLVQLEDVCRDAESALRLAENSEEAEISKIFLDTCLKFNELYQQLYREYSPVLGKATFNNEVSRNIPLSKLYTFHNKLLEQTSNQGIQSEFLDEFLKIPLAQLFMHFEGVIQDTASLLGKKVKPLRIIGDEVLIFEEPYRHLFGSFIHIFNNLIDHGIEDPFTRQKLKKDSEGLITVEIRKESEDFVDIKISDDGAGIDIAKIKKKLEVNKINYTYLSEDEILQTIFLPDFSTKDDIGKFSGRGIGLNAVADELEKIGGSVQVQSRPSKGVNFNMQIPVIDYKFSSQ